MHIKTQEEMEIWYMDALMGPCFFVSDIFHSKHFWQFTKTAVLETVGLIPETPTLFFRHNHQTEGQTPIVEICFCNTHSNFIFFFNFHLFQSFRLAWVCFIYPQFIYVLHL